MNGLVVGYDTEEESGDEGHVQQQQQPKPGACVCAVCVCVGSAACLVLLA